MYLYDESNHSFKSIHSIDGIKFAPMKQYGFDIIHELLNYPLLKFKTTYNTIEGTTFEENGEYTYKPYHSDYQLNISNIELCAFSEIVNSCEYIHSYDIDEIKEEALSLWKEIGFYELKEYITYLFVKYNFNPAYIGDAIIEKLKLILEDFSVSQGYAILYSSVTGAASYKQTGITNKHAVNSINTYIANHIAKRKSTEWETNAYSRNYDLPQTAISMIFFNNILKIGDKGFNVVPHLKNIPNSFINELEEIGIEIDNKLKIRKEILTVLELLTEKQYSFSEIFDLINKAHNNKDNDLKQINDIEILQKLKNLKD